MTTFNKLQKIIAQYCGIVEDSITLNTKLISDLNLTDIEIMEILTKIANEFNLIIPDDFSFDEEVSVTTLNDFIEGNKEL